VGFLITALYLVFVLAAVFLTIVILLQEGKGGGIAAAFGAGGAEAFGVKVGGINKFTGVVAGIFMLCAILLGYFPSAGRSVVRDKPAPPPPPIEVPGQPGSVPPAPPPGGSPSTPQKPG